MSATLYLAVGHGVQTNGVYDPGAIGADGRQEHLEAFQVCNYAWSALRRSGVETICEVAQGAAHDPSYIGSATRANALGVKLAVEVHFDWRQGVDGFSGLYVSTAGHRLASLIGAEFVKRHLPRASDVLRKDLYFLNATHMPALIPEIRRTLNYADDQNELEGEALAAGICAYLGHKFIPAKPKPPPPPQGDPEWMITGPDHGVRYYRIGELKDYFDRQQVAHGDDPDDAPDLHYDVDRRAKGFPPP